MHLLAKTPSLIIQYDNQHQWLYAQWRGDLSPTIVMQGCELLLEHQRMAGTTRLLIDNVLITQPWPGGIEWGSRNWLPSMAEAGLRYLAWVYSPHLQSRLVFDQSQLEVVFPIAASFDDAAEAVEWLEKQPGVPVPVPM